MLPPRLPAWVIQKQWARTAWVSQEAKEAWQPRIQKIGRALERLELLSVEHDLRPSALVFYPPAQLPQLAKEAAAAGLFTVPLNIEGERGEGYSAASSAYDPARPSTFRIAVTKKPKDWADAYAASDERAIGQLLGYPFCCTEFYLDTWVNQGWRDPTLPMAQKGTEGEPFANILLRWIGVRLIRHLPCSLSCADSARIGREFYELGKRTGFQDEMEWALEMLSWPVEWTSLHGVAEIKTPVLKVSTNTDPFGERQTVQKKGTLYPDEGASGLAFPFMTLPKRKVTSSRSFRVATDLHTSNGFTSREAMDTAHQVLLDLADRGFSPSSVLDLGCGNGLLLEKLGKKWKGVQLHGVELDLKRAKEAYERLSGGFVYPGNMTDLSLWDKHYDLAIFMPGRLQEMFNADALAVVNQLKKARSLLLYTYTDREGALAEESVYFLDSHEQHAWLKREGTTAALLLKKSGTDYRCPAKCCSELSLNNGLSLAQLEPLRAKAQARLDAGVPNPYDYDLVTLVPHLKVVRGPTKEDPKTIFRCGHLSSDNLCTIYDRRPRLCREFPATNSNRGTCQGCGFKAVPPERDHGAGIPAGEVHGCHSPGATGG